MMQTVKKSCYVSSAILSLSLAGLIGCRTELDSTRSQTNPTVSEDCERVRLNKKEIVNKAKEFLVELKIENVDSIALGLLAHQGSLSDYEVGCLEL